MDIDVVDLTAGAHRLGDETTGLLRTCFPDHGRGVIEVEVQRIRYGHAFAALAGGHIVGVVTARPPRRDRAFVVYLGVAPAARRRGIAERLLARLVLATGARELEMLVDCDNVPAHRLYAKHGLAPTGREATGMQALWRGMWHDDPASEPTSAAKADRATTGGTS